MKAFLLKILGNVSSSGSGTGITASSPSGSTVKGSKVSNLYDSSKYFFNNSGYFWVPPRTHYGKKMNFNGDTHALIFCVCVTNFH